MSARGFWLFAIAACMMLAMLVAQSVRYAELRMVVKRLESMELELIKQGRELDAAIARHGNTEAVDRAAARNNLKVAEPEHFIVVLPGKEDTSMNESGSPVKGSPAQGGGQ